MIESADDVNNEFGRILRDVMAANKRMRDLGLEPDRIICNGVYNGRMLDLQHGIVKRYINSLPMAVTPLKL